MRAVMRNPVGMASTLLATVKGKRKVLQRLLLCSLDWFSYYYGHAPASSHVPIKLIGGPGFVMQASEASPDFDLFLPYRSALITAYCMRTAFKVRAHVCYLW